MSSTNFKYLLIGIFVVFFISGFISLAIYGNREKNNTGEEKSSDRDVVIWGTIDKNNIAPFIQTLNYNNSLQYGIVNYFEKDRDLIVDEYIRAISVQKAPDILLVDQNIIFETKETLEKIPFSYLPLSQYQNTFIEGANRFIEEDGYIAFPFLVDPFLLLYNQNIQLRENVKRIPKTWKEFIALSRVNKKEENERIKQSLAPLGAYENYEDASLLITSTLLQLEKNSQLNRKSVAAFLEYYKSFSNPKTTNYSWATYLKDARDLFIADLLFLYPSKYSQLSVLKRANPNISIKFDLLPQISSDGISSNYADIYSLAITKSSDNQIEALNVIFDTIGIITTKNNDLSKITPLPTATKEFVLKENLSLEDKILQDAVFYSSFSEIVDADLELINKILRDYIVGIEKSTTTANKLIELLYKK